MKTQAASCELLLANKLWILQPEWKVNDMCCSACQYHKFRVGKLLF